MKMKSSVMSIIVLLAASTDFAGTYLTDTIEYTAGSGSKTATIVIDFDFEHYFVFEYKWDDLGTTGDETATGWDALHTLHQESDLAMVYEDYTNIGWGMYIEDLQYPDAAKYSYYDDGSLGWAYFLSTDNESWIQDTTVYFRDLTDGCLDAWVWTNHDMTDPYWPPIRQPGQVPIPEPASLMLLSLGGIVLARKK